MYYLGKFEENVWIFVIPYSSLELMSFRLAKALLICEMPLTEGSGMGRFLPICVTDVLWIYISTFPHLTPWKSLGSDPDELVAQRSNYFLVLLSGLEFLTGNLVVLVALLCIYILPMNSFFAQSRHPSSLCKYCQPRSEGKKEVWGKCKASDPANPFCPVSSSSEGHGKCGVLCLVPMHRKQDAKNHHYAHQRVRDLLIVRQKGPEDLIMQSQGDKNTGKLAGCGFKKL